LGRGYVIAKAVEGVQANVLMLPVIAPRTMKVFERSEHSWTVVIKQDVRLPTGDLNSDSEKTLLRTVSFFVNPEFKAPTAVTENGAPVDEEWNWGKDGVDTMAPFWVITRMIATAMEKRKLVAQQRDRDGVIPCFNCTIELCAVSCVSIACVEGRMMNVARSFHVPLVTNNIDVADGEDLILEVPEKEVQHKKRKRTWKEELGDDDQRVKKNKLQGNNRQGSQRRRRSTSTHRYLVTTIRSRGNEAPSRLQPQLAQPPSRR